MSSRSNNRLQRRRLPTCVLQTAHWVFQRQSWNDQRSILHILLLYILSCRTQHQALLLLPAFLPPAVTYTSTQNKDFTSAMPLLSSPLLFLLFGHCC